MSEDEKWIIVEELYNGNKIVERDSSYGMVNKEDEVICKLKYYRIHSFNEGVGILDLDQRLKGYIDIDGNIICKCKYSHVSKFQDGLGKVTKEKPERYSNYVNRFGIEIFPPIYYNVNRSSNYYMLTLSGSYQYDILLDRNLNVIFEADKHFEDIREIRKNLFLVNRRNRDHLINLKGEVLSFERSYFDVQRFDPQFKSNSHLKDVFFKDNIIKCENVDYGLNDKAYSYLNLKGIHFLDLNEVNDSRRLIKSINSDTYYKYGYLDEKAKLVIPCKYDYGDDFINGRALVKDKSGCYFIDVDGNKIKEIKDYDTINRFKNERSIVKKDDLYGVINLDGDEIASCNYKFIMELNDDFFAFEKQKYSSTGNYGLLNHQGEVVLPPMYNKIGRYVDNVSIISKGSSRGNSFGLLNKEGKIILPAIYDRIGEFKYGLAIVSVNCKYGVVNKEGKIVVPVIYDRIEGFGKEATCGAVLDKEWIEIDRNGNVVNDDYIAPYHYSDESYTENELGDMYRGAFDGFPDAEWNVD